MEQVYATNWLTKNVDYSGTLNNVLRPVAKNGARYT